MNPLERYQWAAIMGITPRDLTTLPEDKFRAMVDAFKEHHAPPPPVLMGIEPIEPEQRTTRMMVLDENETIAWRDGSLTVVPHQPSFFKRVCRFLTTPLANPVVMTFPVAGGVCCGMGHPAVGLSFLGAGIVIDGTLRLLGR